MSNRRYKVFTGLTGSGQTDAVNFSDQPDVSEEVALVQWSGTGTCNVQVRLHPDLSWITIHTFSATGAEALQKFPYMRLSYTVSSGTANAGIYG